MYNLLSATYLAVYLSPHVDTLWGRGSVVVSAVAFRSVGGWFAAQPLPLCGFKKHPGV